MYMNIELMCELPGVFENYESSNLHLLND